MEAPHPPDASRGAERDRAGRPPAAAGGFTLIEVLVALAVVAVVSVPLAGILGGGWRTQAQAAARAVLQEEAARAVRAVVRGGQRTAGLVHAASACASPDPLCQDGLVVLALEPEVNQVVSFYLEGGSLVRRVCYLDPAAGCPADRLERGPGAAPLLTGVTGFTVERIAADPDLYRVSLTARGGAAAGAAFTLVTVAGPRNTR